MVHDEELPPPKYIQGRKYIEKLYTKRKRELREARKGVLNIDYIAKCIKKHTNNINIYQLMRSSNIFLSKELRYTECYDGRRFIILNQLKQNYKFKFNKIIGIFKDINIIYKDIYLLIMGYLL